MVPDAAPADGLPRATRLAAARSAYLRSAAEQSIDWHPWGAEPFELARRSGRPVLVDVGASWCHWCHVMDETTYADPEVARLLRQHFVTVKVDRDEHPEVDRRLQRQVSTLTGEGGWPLTAFVTPDGEVFLGGTFFPPQDGHGRPGFRRVLKEIARLWKEEPQRIADNARIVREALARGAAAPTGDARALADFADEVSVRVRSSFDPTHGGFGGAPKFPHPSAVMLLLADRDPAEGDGAEIARETLEAMANGGMYDQVGGGFHRYSVDEAWHVPHFEKMAVDNAALLLAYADGLRAFGAARFEEVLRGTVAWAREVLADPAGGWGASQDADNAPGDDGSYFTWTRAELRAVLPPAELRLAVRFFGVDTDARMPHDPARNVLFRLLPLADAAAGVDLPGPPESALQRIVAALKAARDRRPIPTVDRALYADLNGRFVGAFARLAGLLDDPSLLDDARRAADRWLKVAYSPERGIAHRLEGDRASGFGLLDDQVSFAAGLIELAVATADGRYLEPAVDLMRRVDREFRGESGLLRDVAPTLYDGPTISGIASPSYPLEDTPHLAANAAAALAWTRLWAATHDERWRELARSLLAPIGARLGGAGLFAAGAATAARLTEVEPMTIVVAGRGAAADALLRTAHRSYHPNSVVFRGFPPPPFSAAFAGAMEADGPSARAFVCVGSRCAAPVTEPSALAARIRSRATA
ncbi:MAG TPA: thioredoxin domain-containing protein [Thermoplasmata archaeon]|nr:thioredoxin domain-containing protein [Thermoplasmata archaeon]